MFTIVTIKTLLVGVAVATILILGFIVYLNNRKSSTNKAFLFFSLVAVSYSILNHVSSLGLSSDTALKLMRLTIFSAVWYAFLLFYLFHVFPEEKAEVHPFVKLFLTPAVLVTSLLTLTPLVFRSVSELYSDGSIAKLDYGPAIPLFGLVVVGLALYSIVLLYKKTSKATGHEKTRLKYILGGTAITYLSIVIFNFVFPVIFEDARFVSYVPLFTLPFIFSTSYAIIRFHLFNIKIFATELLVFSLWIFILARTIFSDNIQELSVNSFLLFFVVIIGIFLIRSVQKEVSQREKIERLAEELGHANDRLWVANEKLKELDKMKTEFVSIATHQLRSPLTAIKGYSSMVLEGSFGELGDKAREAVDVIFQSSQRLVKVIEDFLNITRIELGTMKYERQEFDFCEMVNRVGVELRPNIEKHGLQFTFAPAPDTDYKFIGDSEKLSQVVGNLIDNAVKYTPSGSINVALERRDSKIRLTVADTGVGVNPEVIPKLFRKFIRADDAGKINISGTGLGLYVAKQIVEAHGGKIWAESEGKDRGSRFIVEV